jgi:hypothetical protein
MSKLRASSKLGLRQSKNVFSTAVAVDVVTRAPVLKGFVSAMRTVPASIPHPDYAYTGRAKAAPR